VKGECAYCGKRGELDASIHHYGGETLYYHHEGPDPTCYMSACADMARDNLESIWLGPHRTLGFSRGDRTMSDEEARPEDQTP
jgi:hypothetical protein